MAEKGKSPRTRTITLEEHFATKAFVDGPGSHLKKMQSRSVNALPPAELLERLLDIGDGRVAAMDAAGVDVQLLSLTAPGVEPMEPNQAVALTRQVNDEVAEAMRRHPGRLVGLACLPVGVPDKAAQELERVVTKHGFRGAVVNGHHRGRYLDDSFFWPILETAEALGVPIYIHPTAPPQPVIDASFTGNFSSEVTNVFARGGWGWHIETAVHVLRLILSGAFDRFKDLQIIIGHMGEGLPFMLPRCDASLSQEVTKLKHPVSAYLRNNVSYAFSGFNYTQCFLVLLLQVGIDRIVFSADYPYKTMEWALSFLDQLPISPADREKITHVNAERLLKI
ncbi:MAG: amidohydrolase family protein [Chloroflexota bacterium]